MFFWYRLTRVFPDKFHRAVKRLCVCVCVRLQGTPEKLIEQLKFDVDGVDTYVDDFLLTYRTFVSTTRDITSRLLAWCDDYSLRDKVFRCFCFSIVFIHIIV